MTTTTLCNTETAAATATLKFSYGNWGSFLQTKSDDNIVVDDDNYTKNKYSSSSSFSKLSSKSLQLCTENLGSETGTDDIMSFDIISPTSPPLTATERRSPRINPYHSNRNHSNRRVVKNFPPPLTTSNSLQVLHRREGGRLIIEAVEAPFRNSVLQAERTDGRLKLSFLTNSTAVTVKDEEEVGPANDVEEEVGPANDVENCDDEINLEMEKEKEKIKRMGRCKEGSKGGLCRNWKPALWVATS